MLRWYGVSLIKFLPNLYINNWFLMNLKQKSKMNTCSESEIDLNSLVLEDKRRMKFDNITSIESIKC